MTPQTLHTKRTLLALLFFVSTFTSLLLLLPLRRQAQIYQDTFRIHILASSDEREDQAIKYTLRDELMPTVSALVKDCQTVKETQNALMVNKEEIEKTASEILEKHGYNEGVLVEIGEFRYNRRVLGDKIYPAGVYPSLRISIGEGEGQNWWSVLFPTVALYVSSDAKIEDFATLPPRVSPDEVTFSFRTLEWLSSVFEKP